MRDSLEKILNVKLSGEVWIQSTLPVASGGLGIHLASELALPAFLSSGHGSLPTSRLLLTESEEEPDYYEQLTEAENL